MSGQVKLTSAERRRRDNTLGVDYDAFYVAGAAQSRPVGVIWMAWVL
jgi:hypothetical protein